MPRGRHGPRPAPISRAPLPSELPLDRGALRGIPPDILAHLVQVIGQQGPIDPGFNIRPDPGFNIDRGAHPGPWGGGFPPGSPPWRDRVLPNGRPFPGQGYGPPPGVPGYLPNEPLQPPVARGGPLDGGGFGGLTPHPAPGLGGLVPMPGNAPPSPWWGRRWRM